MVQWGRSANSLPRLAMMRKTSPVFRTRMMRTTRLYLDFAANFCPSPEKAQVAKVDRSQVRETIIGGWRLVRLDGQYVRVKMTREEKLLIRGESVSQDEDSEEDDEPEPDYQLSDEERPYIDSMQPDFMDKVPILVLKSAIQAAQSARRAVGALGALKIKFTSFSARE